jgi:integrase
MAESEYSALYKRHRTKEPLVTYRKRRDGSRTYYVQHGGTHVPAGSSLEEAKAKKSELVGAKGKGARVILATKLTLTALEAEWWSIAEQGLKEGTRKAYRSSLDKIILPKLGRKKLADIRPDDILSIVRQGRAEGWKESTIANWLKPLRALLDYAVTEKEVLASNPFQGISKKKLPSCNATREHREWTSEDVARLIRVAHERDARKHAKGEYGLAIEAKVRLGLRLGELLGLQYGDIEGDVIHVRRQWSRFNKVDTPKTKKALRRVPLPADLKAKVSARKLANGCGDHDFIFANKKGMAPPQHSNFRRRGWDEAVKAAGLEGDVRVTPHDARHAFASQMADLGLSSFDVAETLGHTSADVTERIYTHAFNREEREKRVREAMARAVGGAS